MTSAYASATAVSGMICPSELDWQLPQQRGGQREEARFQPRGVRLHYPEMALCTDNGAMIALAGAMRLQTGADQAHHNYAFGVQPRWPLEAINK